jgi:hypothetical protein
LGIGAASGALAAFLGNRAAGVRDRLAGEYGEIIRFIDADGDRAQLPYYWAAVISAASSVLAFVGALTLPVADRPIVVAAVNGLIAFASVWTILGFVTILRLDRWHAQAMNRVEALKERAALAERAARRNHAAGRTPSRP